MTGFNIQVEIDAGDARDNLDALIGRLGQPRSFYQAIGNHMVASTGENFLAETTPDGTPWTPLKPATIKARQRRGRSGLGILRERGRLKGSISFQLEEGGVRIGSPVAYAAIHQFGGTIERLARQGSIFRRQNKDGSFGRRFAKRKNKTSVATAVSIGAHQITIPARPFLGVGPGDVDDILRLAEQWLTGNL